MRAKVKSTGEIVEVYQNLDDPNTWFNTTYYKDSDLDFVNTLKDEVTLHGWIARDKDNNHGNDLHLFIHQKPQRWNFLSEWNTTHGNCIRIPSNMYRNITWDDDPVEGWVGHGYYSKEFQDIPISWDDKPMEVQVEITLKFIKDEDSK